MSRSVNFNQPYSPQSSSRFAWLGRLLFRLLLLGVAGTGAAAAGIFWAMANPQPRERAPVVVAAWDWLQNTRSGQLKESESGTDNDLSLPLLQLTDAEQQQLQAQLQGLTTEFNSLSDRARELETRLGIEGGEENLTLRLQRLRQTLQGSATSANPQETTPGKNSLVPGDRIKVTLPTDVLFEENIIFSEEASSVLDTIATELRRYPGATVRIAAHSDATEKPEANRELTFRQGRAIKEYLAQNLGDRYRWVVVGYGQARPLVANDNDSNRQRNRRVEISVD